MANPGALEQGRESFSRRAWAEAYSLLSEADRQTPLEPEDLELAAIAAQLIEKNEECDEYWTRVHHEFLKRSDFPRAARSAFWLAFGLLNRGEESRAAGWLARAQRVLDDAGSECVERGYLLMPVAIMTFYGGDPATALNIFQEASAIAARFGDTTLLTMARMGLGRALVALGRVADGVALFDESMVAITAGEVAVHVAGDVYCTVIEGCRDIFDLRRAQEWTAALTRWCDSQPDLLPYRGQCLIHRSEIMQVHGEWSDAIEAAELACERFLKGPAHPATGAAFYQHAELQRLRGDFSKAEDGYRQANHYGKEPQPGLAQLRLTQSQPDAADAAIRRVVDETQDRLTRARILPAHVEIMLSTGNIDAARASADELGEIATTFDVPFLQAVAAQAKGAVLVAAGEAREALKELRRAWNIWQELEAPYEAARVRVSIGLSDRMLSDEDSAQMEFDAARWVFEQLGAGPDLARVNALSRKGMGEPAGGLTGREVEVLRLVARGKTNRAIADDLFISEKTVARHVSNIFTKLGLASRAGATAYAYEHDLT